MGDPDYPLGNVALDYLDFSPVVDRLRSIVTDTRFLGNTDIDELAQAANACLAYVLQRNSSTVWLPGLLWKDLIYKDTSQISWRQPYSIGATETHYRFSVKVSASGGGHLRVLGSNDQWSEVHIPFAGVGVWQTVVIKDVDLRSAWRAGAPTNQYFTPVLQGKTTDDGTLMVRSMGWSETVNTAVAQFNGINEDDPDFGVLQPFTTPARPIWNKDITNADQPLSADVMYEISNALSTVYHRRTRTYFHAILPSNEKIGPNSINDHPNMAWLDWFDDYPNPVNPAVNFHTWRWRARFNASPPSLVDHTKKLRVMVEGRATIPGKTAQIRVSRYDGMSSTVFLYDGDDPLDRDWRWKEGDLDHGRNFDAEFFVSMIKGMEVRNLVVFSESI